jgi:NUDIX domain/Hydrolase of X-linked nucleoside diphosphate N terminal
VSDSSPQLRHHLWADELRAIANEQLLWGEQSSYNRDRCKRLLKIAAEIAATNDVRDADTIEEVFAGDLIHITPYSGADAAIFNSHGSILLIQRKDDRLWAMPGGVLEVGETPAEGACREAWEESGLEVYTYRRRTQALSGRDRRGDL